MDWAMQRPISVRLEQKGNDWEWKEAAHTWAKAERQAKTNLFSRVGMGQKSVRFTMRKRLLSLHDAIRWQGKHCFLTEIKEIDRMYLEITAALIEPVICFVTSTRQTLDKFNRPVLQEEKEVSFPGFLTEKYLGFAQKEVSGETETTYVLVTPKVIALKPGDLVQVGEGFYSVKIIHDLDGYKNEYEIHRKEDV